MIVLYCDAFQLHAPLYKYNNLGTPQHFADVLKIEHLQLSEQCPKMPHGMHNGASTPCLVHTHLGCHVYTIPFLVEWVCGLAAREYTCPNTGMACQSSWLLRRIIEHFAVRTVYLITVSSCDKLVEGAVPFWLGSHLPNLEDQILPFCEALLLPALLSIGS